MFELAYLNRNGNREQITDEERVSYCTLGVIIRHATLGTFIPWHRVLSLNTTFAALDALGRAAAFPE